MNKIYLLFMLLGFALLLALPGGAQVKEPGGGTDGYCTAGATWCNEYISCVQVGSIYNTSGRSAGGYGDFTSRWTAMAKSTGYAITVTNGFPYSSDQCGIWVDWNQDQDFTDAGEQVTVTGTAGPGPYTATITPPSTAASGNTRMRIRIMGSGTLSPCNASDYGEVEDYTIVVGGTASALDVGVISLILPVPATNLSASETVTVSVYNYGTSVASGFPVSFSIDNGVPITDTITDSIAPGAVFLFTFSQTADLSIAGHTYSIRAFTTLSGDQQTANDALVTPVYHGWATNQNIVAAEYFITSDPGAGNGIAVNGAFNQADINLNLSNINVPVGSTLYLRFKSQNNTWSYPRGYKRLDFFPNTNASLQYAEYFTGSDPGQGNGTPVTLVSGEVNVNDLNLQPGQTAYVRVKDSYNRWSSPKGYKRDNYFPNAGAILQYAEYFTGSDPGQGNGTPATLVNGAVDVDNLDIDPGQAAFVRVKDSYNRWSNPRGIIRPAEPTNSGATLVYAEYFLNNDPGRGNGIPLNLVNGAVSLDSLDLRQGDLIRVRVKDSYDRWSPVRVFPYHFKNISNAEYKKGKNSTTYLPMTLVPPADSACSYSAFKNNVPWTAADTLFVRFQSTEGFYSDWKRGIVGSAGTDKTICEGSSVQLTASGGSSYHWSNGAAGASVWVSPLATTSYWVTVSDGAGATYIDTVTVFVNPLPSAAGIILGNTDVCQGVSPVTYTVPVIPDATSYTWTLPPGASGSSTTNSIGVIFGTSAVSGNISVKGTNSCGNGAIAQLYITVQTAAAGLAGTITGPTSVIQGQDSVTYSIVPISNASSYVWNLPPGATVISGESTNHIIVKYSGTSGSGNLTVYGTNACGDGTPSILYVTVSQGNAITGSVTYNNSAGTPLDSLKVYLKQNGVAIDSTRTDASGLFTFYAKPNGTFTVSARTGKPWAGVNSTDAVKILRHFSALELLTIPIRLKAADVNLTAGINSTDALLVQKRFVGLEQSFARGNWLFEKITGGDTVIVNGSPVNQAFWGLCVGDVNGSNVPSAGAKLAPSVFANREGVIRANTGETIDLPVIVGQDIDFAGMSLVLRFSDEGMEFEGVNNKPEGLIYNAEGGLLRISWVDLNVLSQKENEVLISLRFRIKPALMGFPVTLELSSESEFSDNKGLVINPVKLYIPKISLQENNPLGSLYVYPNPGSGVSNIEYQLVEDARVRIDLLDVRGVIIRNVTDLSEKSGLHKISFQLTDPVPGIYFLRLIVKSVTGQFTEYRKFMITN